jgi:hypothetical protein
MAGLHTTQMVRLKYPDSMRSNKRITGTTLVQLAYNNSAKPGFANPRSYDKFCPVRNDPLPGRGAF